LAAPLPRLAGAAGGWAALPGRTEHQTIAGNFVASAVSIKFDPTLPCPLEAQATTNVI
jgi:hypothetical protein